MVLALDLARLFVGSTLLAFSAWTDLAWRRAPNVLWVVMAGVGIALLAIQAALEWDVMRAQWMYLAIVPVFAAFVWVCYQVGLIAGGADAKALMALGVLLPFPLVFGAGLPLSQSPMPGAFAVLGNGLLAFILVPIAMAVWNVAHGDLRFPALFLGYRADVSHLGSSHVWPMERVEEDGRVRLVLFPSRSERSVEEEREAFAKAGLARIWVTPKLPFLIPLFVGFVAAFLVGDGLFLLVRAAVGR